MKIVELEYNIFGELQAKSFCTKKYDRYLGAGNVTEFAKKLIAVQYKGTDVNVLFKLIVPENVVTLHSSTRKLVNVNYFLFRIDTARFNGYSLLIDKILPIWETEEYYSKKIA